MGNGAILNRRITASSQYDESKFAAWKGRLLNFGGAWSPSVAQFGEWLQVDLTKTTYVTGTDYI